MIDGPNSAGYKTSSKFLEFVNNPIVKKLLDDYPGRIKSVNQLQKELEENDMRIGISTLNQYMKKIKEGRKEKITDGDKSGGLEYIDPKGLRFEKGRSKFGNFVAIIGSDNKNNWRRFRLKI
jgi:hypothetical protein